MILLFIISSVAYTDIPDGGTNLIRNFLDHYSRNGSVTVSKVAVDHADFETALSCATGTNVPNQWSAQLVFSVQSGIEAGDVILVAFYARTTASLQETGAGALTVCIENRSTYEKVVYHTLTIGAGWNRYYLPLSSNLTLPSNNLNCAFHLGFASQTIEVADVRFINYKDQLTVADLPVTRATYDGREADAAWRAEADERIDLHRKGQMKIKVVDDDGSALPGASVSVGMRRHHFAFGTAIDAGTYHANSTYREKIHELFNEVVFENDLKMNSFFWRSDFQKRRIMDVIDELDDLNITARGHTVVWPSFRYNPQFLSDFSNNPDRLRFELDQHIEEICTMFRGRLIDWDVINEPYSEQEFMNILGKDVMVNWFNQVRNYDPYARLYINDFGILSGMGLNTTKQNAYIETIKYIDDNGGQVDGIGLQGHFSESVTSINRLKTVLDKFAELEKDIKITEFDIDTDDRELQVDYTRDFMTMVFSHPTVKGILIWGFWEGRHWRPESALYNRDWTIREHGEMYRDLLQNQWWTADTTLVTNEEGYIELDGFLGTYAYRVEHGDRIREGTFDLLNPNSSDQANAFMVYLNEQVPVELTIVVEGESWLCEGGQVVLSVDVPAHADLRWIKDGSYLDETSTSIVVASQGSYAVEAAVNGIHLVSTPVEVFVVPYPGAVISTDGPADLCPGEKINLQASVDTPYTFRWMRDGTYFAGSTHDVTVGEAGSYVLEVIRQGCRALSEPLTVTMLSGSDDRCATSVFSPGITGALSVYPNPTTGSFTISIPDDFNPHVMRIISLNGNVVYQADMVHDDVSFSPALTDGIYILEAVGASVVMRTRIVKM